METKTDTSSTTSTEPTKKVKYRYVVVTSLGSIFRQIPGTIKGSFLFVSDGTWCDEQDWYLLTHKNPSISKQAVDFFIADGGYNFEYFRK